MWNEDGDVEGGGWVGKKKTRSGGKFGIKNTEEKSVETWRSETDGDSG